MSQSSSESGAHGDDDDDDEVFINKFAFFFTCDLS